MRLQRIVETGWKLFALAVFCWCFSLFAQEPATNTVPTNGSGVNLGAFGTAQFYIDVGTLFIGAAMTAAWKKWGPSIPKDWFPYLATFLGFVAGALATVTLGDGVDSPMDVAKTVMLALGNVGVRELKDRFIPEPDAPTA